MSVSFAHSVDAHGDWRSALESRVRGLARFLREHELLDEPAADLLESLRQRLAGEKLVVAFVAEFSRGKSELINAIFFADTGRRIMPATPGRTTMCPVELGYEAGEPAALALLPIETRLQSTSLAELRRQPRAWQLTPLDIDDTEGLAQALTQVMQTRRVSVETARNLGFWDDAQPDDNPPVDAQGEVEVPMWRHALINLPHPLLKRGLVVLDTPGLNAIGAEPELTVGLLPTAHATVFVLGADTGVTKSDLAIWRDHLSAEGVSRYVVLNKIDTLADTLHSQAHTDKQIQRQCDDAAHTLKLPRERVFPLSAKQALAARVAGDEAALIASRLPALEDALSQRLLPQRRELLAQTGVDNLAQVEVQVQRRLTDRRRQLAEQLLELRGLRGKSASKVKLMLKRVDGEVAEFDQCTAKLQAMRAVHGRMLKDALLDLASDRLREHIDEMQQAIRSSLLQLGARKAFLLLCSRLRERLARAQDRGTEIHAMLEASFVQLNTEFGFSLMSAPAVDLSRFGHDLELIERNYVQYLGLTQALKLTQARFLDQFRRMLVSRLRVVFESASGELELWNKTASAQIDTQLRERRRGFKRRREALERIQSAAGELETRLSELADQDLQLQLLQRRMTEMVNDARAHAQSNTSPTAGASEPQPGTGTDETVDLLLDFEAAQARA
ncbi:MAG: dynamin family protein [Methylibium sp.]|uniref:dynamin family protein n=1 Tax=Methylibium sp. TaxID=2067992 RepID=UPI0017D78437|nr:dynamin family protein [Methylibium sp.]MBA3598633.1 dynamin family protein [Methylibium sp.]